MDNIVIQIPLKNEYLTTVRLATGGICATGEFDVDFAEDLKVCVTESLLILMRNGYASAKITFVKGDLLSCKIVGEDKTRDSENSVEDEISYALLDALIGGAKFTFDGDVVKEISFEA